MLLRPVRRTALFVLPIILALSSPSWSAKPPADVAGTAWRTEARAVAVVRARGARERVRGAATSDVSFGPRAGLAGDACTWVFTDDNFDQFQFPGTYALNAKGKPQLTLDATAVQAEVQEVFEAILARDLPGTLPPGISITYKVKKTKAKFKAWTKGDGSRQAKSTLLLKFAAVARGEGQRVTINVTLKHAAKGGPAE